MAPPVILPRWRGRGTSEAGGGGGPRLGFSTAEDTTKQKGRAHRPASHSQNFSALACFTPSQRRDLLELLGGHRPVDREQCDGVAADLGAAEVEVGDVDAEVAEQRAEPADMARLVLVGDVEHRLGQLGIHVDGLDLDDARLAVGEDGAGNAPLLPLGHHRQADIALIGALLVAGDDLDIDAAILGDLRGRDHVGFGHLRLQHAVDRRGRHRLGVEVGNVRPRTRCGCP